MTKTPCARFNMRFQCNLSPRCFKALFEESGRGGLPSLKQISGSVLLEIFSTLPGSCNNFQVIKMWISAMYRPLTIQFQDDHLKTRHYDDSTSHILLASCNHYSFYSLTLLIFRSLCLVVMNLEKWHCRLPTFRFIEKRNKDKNQFWVIKIWRIFFPRNTFLKIISTMRWRHSRLTNCTYKVDIRL